MNTAMYHTADTLTDNDDVRTLLGVVQSDFERYSEVQFKQGIENIRGKWPLLGEIKRRRSTNIRPQSLSLPLSA